MIKNKNMVMMFGSSDDSYDKDRVTNMSAVTVQLGVSARTIDTRERYEQTYAAMQVRADLQHWV